MNSDVIHSKVSKIKKALGKRCFFCENTFEGENIKEIFFLPVCEICYNKYELNKELNEKREETNGYGVKWRENVKLIKELFANRCFFCERDYIPKNNEQSESEELSFLFPLCNASCSRKYKIIKAWQEFELLTN